jgi:hypothetical protein
MSSVATQSLLGQSPEVVQGVLGAPRFHQPNPANQTDLYVYSPNYLRDLFPVLTTGIIGVYRNNQCIALKVVFSKTDQRYENFIYNREMASRLFDRVIGGGYAYWQEVEADPRDNDVVHYVYCMGNRTATTWDANAADQTIASDISIFIDSRCEPNDDSDLNQPITTPPPVPSPDLPFLRPTTPTPVGPNQEVPESTPTLAFSDIADNLYEAEILRAANTYHVITGYADGTFRPTDPVTRDQGLTMLLTTMQAMAADAGAMAIPDELTEPPFADVPVDHKSARQFYFAQQTGILRGDADNNAHPDSPMSRAELIAMVHGGLQVVVEFNYSPTTRPGQVIEPVETPVVFSDLEGHWGQEVIQAMGTYGVASALNETGTEFAPDPQAQRDYTAAVLVRLAELQFRPRPGTETRPNPVQVFPDIGNDIYKDEILRATNTNTYAIVSGYEDGKFHPLDQLSREQAVVILVNTMQILVQDPEALQIPETLSDPAPFPDIQAGGSATRIQFAKEAGLISGDDQGNFRPLDRISRSEVMAMIHKGLGFVVEANYGRAMALAEAIQDSPDPTAAFTDVPTDHWVQDVLPELRRWGIATPYNEAGTAFKPDQACLRNYATAAMVRMAEVEFATGGTPRPDQPVGFTDIQDNPFESEILLAANTYHLVSGYEDGSFKPAVPATREQAVAMLVDALAQKVANKEVVKVPDHLTQPPFRDVDINRWSAPRIHFAKQVGIISGDGQGRFNPEAQLSRAQLIAMADQTLRYAIWADLGKSNIPLTEVMAVAGDQAFEFTDIPSTHWGLNAITEMGAVGLAMPQQLDRPDQFAPNSASRRDFTVATCVRLVQAPYSDATAAPPEVTLPETPPPETAVPFVDIADSPYTEEIEQAVTPYQIVAGNDDGLFHPAESISREHLVAMLVKGLQQMVEPGVIDIPTTVAQAPFIDVPANSVFAPQIKFVADTGIMSGDRGTNLFRPKNDLTRAELMAVIDNALTFAVQTRYGNDARLEDVVALAQGLGFTDLDGHWAQADVERMGQLGIALPQPAGSQEFVPNQPSRRDFATASVVHMIEVPFTGQSSSEQSFPEQSSPDQ